jgi:hypothetical protein
MLEFRDGSGNFFFQSVKCFNEGQPLFKMRKKYVSENFKEEFSPAQLKGAAEVLARLFNLMDVSIGLEFDLPKLLQAYFLDEERRKEINKLL